MIKRMTWWSRQSSVIPLSWLAFLLLGLFLWRLESRLPAELLALNAWPIRASVALVLLSTAVHGALYHWRERVNGAWLAAAWCSLLYAAIIFSMIIWRLSTAFYG